MRISLKSILKKLSEPIVYYKSFPYMQICEQEADNDSRLLTVHLAGKNIYMTLSAGEIVKKDFLKNFNETDKQKIIDLFFKERSPRNVAIYKRFSRHNTKALYEFHFNDCTIEKCCCFSTEEIANDTSFLMENIR